MVPGRHNCFDTGMSRIIVITGTDTGVGKTLLTGLLAAHLVREGVQVAALKPICSGDREDARFLRRAVKDALPLAAINPWHFRAPIAPLLAARQAKAAVSLEEVVAHIRSVANHAEVVLVEGAGGLLSPLGEGFSTRELQAKLNARLLIVAANRLGAVNHVRLTLAALPPRPARQAQVILMAPAQPDAASRSNPVLLREFLAPGQWQTLPHFQDTGDFQAMLAQRGVRRVLEALLN